MKAYKNGQMLWCCEADEAFQMGMILLIEHDLHLECHIFPEDACFTYAGKTMSGRGEDLIYEIKQLVGKMNVNELAGVISQPEVFEVMFKGVGFELTLQGTATEILPILWDWHGIRSTHTYWIAIEQKGRLGDQFLVGLWLEHQGIPLNTLSYRRIKSATMTDMLSARELSVAEGKSLEQIVQLFYGI